MNERRAGKLASGYALRDFPRANRSTPKTLKEIPNTHDHVHLCTAARSKDGPRSLVKIQSAQVVKIRSAPTRCWTVGC